MRPWSKGQSTGPFGPLSIRLHPIEGAHAITQVYDAFRSTIVQMCRPLDWSSIGVRRVGWKPEVRDNPAVVMIIVKKTTNDLSSKAEAVARNAAALLKIHDLPDVEVHIACSMDWAETRPLVHDTCKTEVDDDNLREALSDPLPKSGASLGVRGRATTTSGSLGPYVRITMKNGEPLFFAATTAHHVVAPASAESVRPFVDTTPLVAESPAGPDLAQFLLARQELASILHEQANTARRRLQTAADEQQGLNGRQLQSLDRILQQILDQERAALRDVEQTQRADVEMGRVLASSGLCQPLSPSMPLQDWALIPLAPNRQQEAVFVSSEINRGFLLQKFKTFERQERSHLEAPLTSVNKTITVANVMRQEDDNHMPLALLRRRTSGYSCGRVNGLRDDVRLDYGIGARIHARLVAVVDCAAARFPFSAPGDSGAAVYDRSGRVMGTLLGGHEQTRASYILPIDDMLNGMKAVLATIRQDIQDIEVV